MDDVLQAVFLTAYQKFSRLKGKVRLKHGSSALQGTNPASKGILKESAGAFDKNESTKLNSKMIKDLNI